MSTIAPDHGDDQTSPQQHDKPRAGTRLWGWWTVHKLQILQEYLQAFATTTKHRSVERIYLDLFAGWPKNHSRETDEEILGSVHRALRVEPPFTRVALFEVEGKAALLEQAVRAAYPGRTGLTVYAGDCNEQVAHALTDLSSVNWAPTFAFIDQFDSEVHWSTLERISQFRQGKTKAEMWLLFAAAQYPRGLNVHGVELNAAYGDTLTRMLGTDEWTHIAEGRRQHILEPAAARAEWVNLMRWRLERVLGYAESHAFTMKNTNGTDIYDMIFVSDHPVGEKIMRHLYGKAMTEHEEMRQQALALRRHRRQESSERHPPLFAIDHDMVRSAKVVPARIYESEPPHDPYRLPSRG